MRRSILVAALVLGAGAARGQTPCFDVDYGVPIGNGNDVVLPLQPIGFPFPFGGGTHTDFYASTNGFLYLRNGPAPTTPSALCCAGEPSTLLANSVGPMLCPFWTDLELSAANFAHVYVERSASHCTITWHNAVLHGDPGATRFHVQLRLSAAGEIAFAYTNTAGLRVPAACLAGVSPGNGAADPGAADLSAAGTSAGDTLYETFDAAGPAFDLAGRSLVLTPANPTMAGSPIAHASAACALAGAPAGVAHYGVACYGRFQSIYEFFPYAQTFDLDGKSLGLFNGTSAYFAFTSATPTFVAPSASATVLPLGDDSEVTVTLASPFLYDAGTTPTFVVCSNGLVSIGAGNGTAPTPAVAAFLDLPSSVFACWHDYDPSAPGSGQVKFEEVGDTSYITWDGVFSRGTTAPETFQFQFDRALGNARLVFQSASGLGNSKLVGFSVGGPSLDPRGVDLSNLQPFTFFVWFGPDEEPLGLAVSGFPFPGAAVTLTATGVPANTVLGAIGLGLARHDPGLPVPVQGPPSTCRLHTDCLAVTPFVPPASFATFTAPPGPTFLGTRIRAQASVLTTSTPTFFRTSAGLELYLGN